MNTTMLKLIGVTLLTSSGAVSALPVELSEDELGSIRGKYTVSGQDYYFGLLMKTQYLQADGQLKQADMQVEISSASGVQISVSEGVSSTNAQADFEVLGQQSGLQQRIQIAGSGNHAVNDMTLAEGKLSPLSQGVVVTVGQQWMNSRGDILFSTQPGEIGMQISLPGGMAVQGVLNSSGNGQLLQSINIQGGAQGVSNLSELRYAGIEIGSLSTSILGQQLLGLNQ